MQEANPWRAGCGESRMPGSEGGVGKRPQGNAPCSYLTDERPTGNSSPASTPCTMGQRPHPMAQCHPEDVRDWSFAFTSIKEVRGQPDLPSVRSGFRDERLGSTISRHLNTSVEYIVVNVGGPCVEGSSPPLKRMGVGGSIVVRGRESRLHGEGSQGIDIRQTK
jgi:hypothetical protein